MQPQGPVLRECVHPGVWTGGKRTPRCVGKLVRCIPISQTAMFKFYYSYYYFLAYFRDVTPPHMDCPGDLTVEARPGSAFAVIDLALPNATGKFKYRLPVHVVFALHTPRKPTTRYIVYIP